ncbi:MAG: hypothetical protein V1804_02290 [Patescibacteria group bacterium]
MKTTIDLLEFQELEIGEKFIIIYTEDENEKRKLSKAKEVYRKISNTCRLECGKAIGLVTGDETVVARKTPVIRISI